MLVPKGKIVAIGGNEDKGSSPVPEDEKLREKLRFFDHGILKRIHDELHGLGTRIEIVTTASLIPDEIGKIYTDAFLLLGCNNVGILPIQHPDDTKRPDYLQRIKETHAVMFTGGDQHRITETFRGSEMLQIITARYQQEEKFLISGTSAGTMALSGIMINGSLERSPLLKGTVELSAGLDILDLVIIDTHFVNRRRIPRLIEAIAANPTHIGIGLSEDTGILITQNNCIETIGSGLVIVIDARKAAENNYSTIATGEPLCLENLVMHVLPKGRSYNMLTGEFMDEPLLENKL